MPAPAQNGRVRVSGGVMAGLLLSKSLPRGLCDGQANGAMVVHVILGKDGRPLSATPVAGPQQNTASLAASILAWRYRPYLLNGEPVEIDTTITVNVNCGSIIP